MAAPQRARRRAHSVWSVRGTPWVPGSAADTRAVLPGSARRLWGCNKLETRFFGHFRRFCPIYSCNNPCLPFTGIAHQNNQTLYGQNNQTVVRFTTTSEAKSDRNRRNRQNTGYFPGIPGFFQVYPQNTGYFADFAEFGGKPASDSAQSSKK